STNYSLLIIVIFLWSFYTTLGVFFFLNKLGQPAYRFLWHLALLSTPKRTYALVINQGLMNTPATLHALLVLNYSVINSEYSFYAVLAYLFFAHAIPSYVINKKLSGSYQIHENARWLKPLFRFKIYPPVWIWPLLFSLKRQPVLWLISKTLVLILLQFFFWVDQLENYPFTWLAIGSLTSFSLNIPLIAHLAQFRRSYATLFNNLPISPILHGLRIALLIVALISMECVMIANLWPMRHTFSDLVSLVLFGFTLNLTAFMISILNYQNQFFYHYFWIFIILFLLVLSGISLIVLSIIGLAVSLLLCSAFYKLAIR
ncbi:MAG: hypothetical protein AAF519_18080, partial [Bacteroidota bacterium]